MLRFEGTVKMERITISATDGWQLLQGKLSITKV